MSVLLAAHRGRAVRASAPTWCCSASCQPASSSASACSATAPTSLLVTAGRRGDAAAHRLAATRVDFADPLPQALVLTAIVISFGVTALLLALAYRSWLLTGDDEVEDDVEDRASSASTRRRRGRRRRAGRRRRRASRSRDVTPCSPLPIVLPLLGAALSILVGRSRAAQRVIGVSVLAGRVVPIAVAILVARRPRRHDRRRRPAAGRRRSASPSSPTGSRRSCCSSAIDRCCSPCSSTPSASPGAERNHVGFQSVYLVLAAGVSAVVPHRRPVQPVRRRSR